MKQEANEQLNGKIVSVIFQNEENGYSVIRLENEDGEMLTVVGCIPMAAPGETLRMTGRWTRHAKHGEQFECERVRRANPTEAASIYDYLASGILHGVGPATAALLVSNFGDDTLNIIRNHPKKLSAVKGISARKAMEMSRELKKLNGMRDLMEYFSGSELPLIFALRTYRCFGDKSMELVRENPYILCSEQIGAAFDKADELALSEGMEADAPQRISAAALYELRHNLKNGHCFIPYDKLISATAQMISVEAESAEECILALIESGDIVRETVSNCDACYLASVYEAETFVADNLLERAGKKALFAGSAEKAVARFEAEEGFSLAPLQMEALTLVSSYRVCVLTGGPGTGKTTTVRAVLSLFDQMGLDTLLAAPTGRAAKRLSELAGCEAYTIHRLLGAGYDAETERSFFRMNENNPLRCSAVIVDECSMIDIELMKALLCAIPSNARILLVGDADQLPSVGPGNVFRDILRSGAVPSVRLSEIFRQSEESRIIVCAHEINEGRCPDVSVQKSGFYFMRRSEPESAAQTIAELFSRRLPENMHIPVQDIQVLSPTRKGLAGTMALNAALQAVLNPPSVEKQEFKLYDRVFRVGDRVMQIRNDYDAEWVDRRGETGNGVFNGDTGVITKIEPPSETLWVDYDGHLVSYLFEQAADLEHAWAVTVHKSQGSEYRAVILSLSQAAPQLLYRSLLYTGVTRAQELLVAVGEERVLRGMTENNRRTKRYSGLWYRLAAK